MTTVSSAASSSLSTRARAATVKSSATNAGLAASMRWLSGGTIVKSGIGRIGADGAGV